MKIVSDINIADFKAWSGGKNTLDRVIKESKCDVLESVLEDLYPNGMTDTQLNDLLWFDDETVYEWCDIRSETTICNELEDAKETLENLKQDYEDECYRRIEYINESSIQDGEEEMDEDEIESLRSEIWNIDYKQDAEMLMEDIRSLEEELNDI